LTNNNNLWLGCTVGFSPLFHLWWPVDRVKKVYTNKFLRSKGGVRLLSILSENNIYENEENFKKWFVGFVDGEGSFPSCCAAVHYSCEGGVVKTNIKYYSFVLEIGLHIDDIETLNTIKEKLKFKGNISIKNSKVAVLKIRNIDEIVNIIIPIFDKYSLLTKKRMDYLVWKEALDIYLNHPDLVKKLEIILDKTKNLNKHRDVNFDIDPKDITKEWLIGFIEGEGSFYIDKDNKVMFELGQRVESINTIKIIKTYLESLKSKSEFINNISWDIPLYHRQKESFVSIRCHKMDFLVWVLIPYLSSVAEPKEDGGVNFSLVLRKKIWFFFMKSCNRNKNERVR